MTDENLVYAMLCLWARGYPADLAPPYDYIEQPLPEFRGYHLVRFESEADMLAWGKSASGAARRAGIPWDYDCYAVPKSRSEVFFRETMRAVEVDNLMMHLERRVEQLSYR